MKSVEIRGLTPLTPLSDGMYGLLFIKIKTIKLKAGKRKLRNIYLVHQPFIRPRKIDYMLIIPARFLFSARLLFFFFFDI